MRQAAWFAGGVVASSREEAIDKIIDYLTHIRDGTMSESEHFGIECDCDGFDHDNECACSDD